LIETKKFLFGRIPFNPISRGRERGVEAARNPIPFVAPRRSVPGNDLDLDDVSRLVPSSSTAELNVGITSINSVSSISDEKTGKKGR